MSAYGNDCHFYYNSTCTKGDSCAFRHCEPAKSCNTTCTFWQQGICSKPNCPYRHAELPTERNRQAIPCYWENQPVGCSKPNCQYQHFKPRPTQPVQTNPVVTEPVLPDTRVPPPMFGQLPVTQSELLPGVPVIQPVVVHFSDSEVESEKSSPIKSRKGGNSIAPSTSITRTIGQDVQQNIVSTIPSTTVVPTVRSQEVTPVTTVTAGTSQDASGKPGQIPVIQSTSQTGLTKQNSSSNLPDLDYFIGRPYVPKPPRSPVRNSPRYDTSPDRKSYDSRYSRSPSPRSLSPWRRRSRSPSPRSRSPRRRSPSYSRDRSRSPRRWSPRRRSPSPRRYNVNKNSISRPQDRYLQSRRPGYGRSSRGRNDSPSYRGQKPIDASTSKKISLSKIKDATDSSEDDKVKVKSLEEIQRAKALLSMGLIELKSGKIVKVGEVDKYKEAEAEDQSKKEPPKKKKIIKKVVVKSKKPKVVSPVKKVEEKVEVQAEAVNDYEEDLDDLGEEPEIDICEAIDEDIEDTGSQAAEESEEPAEEEGDEDDDEEWESSSDEEPVQYQEDIRRAVRKEPEVSIIPPQPRVISTLQKKKRNVIVEEAKKGQDKNDTEVKTRPSILSRLGRKVDAKSSNPTSKDSNDSKIGNLQKSLMKANVIKSRIGTSAVSDNTVGSSNTGTVRGIKSRLGIGAVINDKPEVSSLEPRKLVLKRTIENVREDERSMVNVGDDEDGKEKEVTKRRRWNKGSALSRLGQNESDDSNKDLKKIVITRNIVDDDDSRSQEKVRDNKTETVNTSQNQVKSTLSRINKIIEEKKDSKDQNALPKSSAKLNVWSTRVTESIAAVAPTRKQSDIDLQDSSSNDSLTAFPSQSRKESKTKKISKQERAIYVPPGRKRPVSSYDDQEEGKEISPPKVHKKHKEKKSEPETIKTYSQIMEEKRKKLEKQREKKAKAEEKAIKKKLKKDKENEKASVVNTDSVDSKPTLKSDSTKRRDSLLDSLDFIMQDKEDSTADHIDLLPPVTLEEPEVEQEKDTMPRRKSDDSWLEFSKEDLELTVGETADDDDLLREIDELLA